ncbi:putative estradiol 17-beta-dehydrogenase protein [Zalerion maritima]|uniref:Estradiol 17-beta-dehydrogenase protein n=1 Tax=Zalerion maritima TaxID=339359 RepID=A0AAD5RH90_9PEZI|nr:putative estradiol 17-beta-dehydrogenase protein [Zalerion maritima]
MSPPTTAPSTPTKPTILISGASSGFGRTLALLSLARGYNVIATSRSLSSLAGICPPSSPHFSSFCPLALDVTASDGALRSLASAAARKFGGVTHVFACAGYILDGAWEESSSSELASQFATNVLGMVGAVRAFLPHLRAAGESWKSSPSAAPRPGILTFGSLGSWTSGSGTSLYCGTKWACSGLTEGLKEEMRPFGVDVMVVEPGMFRTGFLSSSSSTTTTEGGGGSHRILTAKSLPIYSGPGGPVHATRQALDSADDKQVGDTEKGCNLILDVMMRTGKMEGREEVPVRLPLGKDAIDVIRGKCQETLKLLEEWEELAVGTAHDDGISLYN